MLYKGVHDCLSLVGAVPILLVAEIEDDLDLASNYREIDASRCQLPSLSLPEGLGELLPVGVLIGVFEERLARPVVDNGLLLVLFGGDRDDPFGFQLYNFSGRRGVSF